MTSLLTHSVFGFVAGDVSSRLTSFTRPGIPSLGGEENVAKWGEYVSVWGVKLSFLARETGKEM